MNKSKLAVTIRLLPAVEERIAKEYQPLRLRFIRFSGAKISWHWQWNPMRCSSHKKVLAAF
jgi:hypothetical protein